MKKLIFTFITLLFLIPNINALEINSDKVLLINLNEDKILFEKKASEPTSIASLTKIMTTIVALDYIDDYNKKIQMTKDMFAGLNEENAYQIGLRVGQIVTMNDLLYGTFISSGADATRGLTFTIAASEEKFVELMNQKAKDIGLLNTNFKNPIGLDASGQSSTLKDVAKLLEYALKNEKFKEIFETKSYTLSDNTKTIYSSLIQTSKYYGLKTDFIIGAKTGYTIDAGRALASVAIDKNNNVKYLLVTTNASNTPEHVEDAITIYNHYFENFKYHELVKKGQVIKTLKVKHSNINEIKIKFPKTITKYHDNTFDKNKINYKYEGQEELSFVNKKGLKLGNIKVYYDNELIEELEINLDEEIKFSLMTVIKEYKYLLISTIILLTISIIIIKKKHKK